MLNLEDSYYFLDLHSVFQVLGTMEKEKQVNQTAVKVFPKGSTTDLPC